MPRSANIVIVLLTVDLLHANALALLLFLRRSTLPRYRRIR